MDDAVQSIQKILIFQILPHPLSPIRAADTQTVLARGSSPEQTEPLQPLLVRQKKDIYEIVSGEESYHAAFARREFEVPCQIVELDDAEVLRQLALRYRSTIDDPLRLGQVFRELAKIKSWSQDELAAAVEMSVGTVRNHLRYVDAYERRSKYTGHPIRRRTWADPALAIGRLTIDQVRAYLSLPAEIGDIWMDAGAPFDAATAHLINRVKGIAELNTIVQLGWSDRLCRTPEGFAESLERLIAYIGWFDKNAAIPNADAYLNSVVAWDLPVQVLDCLPTNASKRFWWNYLTPAAWEHIIEECSALDLETRELCAWVRGRVEEFLKSDSVKTKERAYSDGRKALNIFNAPMFIRDSLYLTTEEKSRLAEFKAEGPDDLVLEAKRLACERLSAIRTTKGWDEPVPDIRRICVEVLIDLQDEQWFNWFEAHLQNPDAARERVLAMLYDAPASQTGVVGGRPAREVLREHISGLRLPELALVAGSLRPAVAERLTKLWLLAAAGEMPASAKAAGA